MERKILPFEIKQIEETSDNFTFTGVLAAYGNVDFDNDRIQPGAFKDFLKNTPEPNIPIFWVHRSTEPVGIYPISDMREDKTGLFVKGLMPRSDTFVSGRVIPQMKIGSVRKQSIGFDTEEFKYDGDVRDLTKLFLWEGSLVPLAANPQAEIQTLKNASNFNDLPLADRNQIWDEKTAEKNVLDFAGNLETSEAQAEYKKAFFSFDSEKSDIQASYKMQFADIINGRLTAVPAGIFAAAASVSDVKKYASGIIRNIEKYYKKMDMESPFSNAFRIDDFKSLDPRTLENLLKSGVRFSGKKSKLLVSIFKEAGLCDTGAASFRDGEKIGAALDKILTKIKT